MRQCGLPEFPMACLGLAVSCLVLAVVSTGCETGLCEAAKRGDVERARELLEGGADPDATESGGDTALHFAAVLGHLEIVELLLSHGAQVDTENDSGVTPLLGAAATGQAKVVEYLLAHGADIEHRDDVNGETALHYAADHEAPGVYAPRNGHCEAISVLLERGADVNATGCDGQTPLMRAVGWPEAVQQLLEAGADVHARTRLGNTTALHDAVLGSHSRTAELLLAAGAEHDIHTAAGYGDVKTVARILEQHPDLLEQVDNGGRSPLYWASHAGQAEVVELLLEAGADPDSGDDFSSKPLYAVIAVPEMEDSLLQVARLLLEHGADLTIREGRNGGTYLHWAAQLGYLEMVQVLVEEGADVNARDKEGRTPLYSTDSTDVAAFLLENGADPNAKVAGWSLLEMAELRGDGGMVQLLRKYGATE